MKWFTREWARGDLSDEEWKEVPSLYATHLEEIALRLSPGALDLALNVNVHDGRVKRWRQTDSTVELEIVSGDLESGYQRVTLTFEDASVLKPRSLDVLDFDEPRTELLYDEVDLAGEASFDYRLLVWPKGELAIRFASVAVNTTDATAGDR